MKTPTPPSSEATEARDTAAPGHRSPESPQSPDADAPTPVREIGGRKDGTDPTRFGDWEKAGRCIDF